MSIVSVVPLQSVVLSEQPALIFINTTDSLATVLATGYLNNFVLVIPLQFVNNQMALVLTTDGCIWLQVKLLDPNKSLVYPSFGASAVYLSPTFSSVSTAAILSSYRNAQVSYSFNATVNISILAGQSITATLKYADNAGMSVNPVTVDTAISSNSGVLGLTQINTLKLNGMIPAGKYRQVTFSITGGATLPNALAGGQEVLL